MVTVPAPMPLTIPEAEPTEAIAGLLLTHVPPTTASDNAVVEPTATLDAPLMADGVDVTVATAVTAQLVGSV